MESSTEYRRPLERSLRHALAYLENLDDAPVAATATAAELRARFGASLPSEGADATQIVDDLVEGVDGGITGNVGGRFFGWVIGGTMPASLAADWMASAWDQNGGLYAVSPAAAIVEEVCGEWLKDLLRLPVDASFALLTGCQMAHVTCLAAARNKLLSERGWNVEEQGLRGGPDLKIVTSDQQHGTVPRAARMLGIGTGNIVEIPTDEDGRLEPDALANALGARVSEPTIVVLQAGEINLGAFDPFEDLIPLAHQHGAWVHVDGAFGLWAAATEEYAHHLAGVDQADSWATDGHKWLNVPFDTGFAFVAHPEAHRAAMTAEAAYITGATGARDQLDWNPEWSRRSRGFATYAAIRELGRKGVADLVERTCRHAQTLLQRIGDLPDVERLGRAQINQGLVRFLDPDPNASDADHDRRTDAVIDAVKATGEAFFTGTTWRGRRCMRISSCNWLTNERDIDRTVEAVESCLGARVGS